MWLLACTLEGWMVVSRVWPVGCSLGSGSLFPRIITVDIKPLETNLRRCILGAMVCCPETELLEQLCQHLF